ncbi:PREDICTED: insulin-like peptide receptor isoform X1 [Nicrophorus vespilloides]|uniref:Tyrosine-protein kinase receptor n=1 Tax=Nicrophorus vespilloides TaxID=110193 RepID=A0ABM1NC25_NICVS|nr:PREDICTED: insulin-like peptide receptor isoform X1 [Nicrophorus vespilloides]
MLPKYLYYIVWFLLLSPAECRICTNVRIQNNLTKMEKDLAGCTIITENLVIVLLENTTAEEFDQYSFPDLIEVEQLFLIFRVSGLTSVGKLFPNLRAIRGRQLLTNYAFILQDVPDLREIGLTSLQMIDRGAVRIAECNQLCFVETVAWDKLGTTLEYINPFPHTCPTCSSNCTHCWNGDKCQNMERTICMEYQDEGKCVPQCPSTKYKYKLNSGSRCLTEKECYAIGSRDNVWFPFGGNCLNKCPHKYQQVNKASGWCRYCGENCIIRCAMNKGDEVNSLSTAEKLEGCTHIEGSLKIRVTSTKMAEEMETHLGRIKRISGYLLIYRSHFLQNLNFLKDLRVIEGKMLEGGIKSLIIHNNQELVQLWDHEDIRILKGRISFHDNPKLCLQVIEKFSLLSNITYNTKDVSPYSNGEAQSCKITEFKIEFIEINPTNVVMRCEEIIKTQHTNGYFIYFREDTGEDITFYTESCDDNGWSSVFTNDNIFVINSLKPYTKYAYYIKSREPRLVHSRQTDIKFFQTLSEDPSPPEKITVIPDTYNSIRLSWQPPLEIRGRLSHYVIYGYPEYQKKSFIDQRNYCRHPMKPNYQKRDSFVKMMTSISNGTCECEPLKVKEKEFEPLCTSLIDSQNAKPCKNEFEYAFGKHHARYQKTKRSGSQNKNSFLHNTTKTSFLVQNLRHYTNHIFMISACNVRRGTEDQCSEIIMVYNKTLAKPDADVIDDFTVAIVEGNNVIAKWSEPAQPNAVIISYQIEYKSRDAENAETKPICITRKKHEANNFMYKLTHFSPGSYSIRVQATSLGGPGPFTPYHQFQIIMPSDNSLLIGVSAVFSIIAIAALFVFAWFIRWKRKRRPENHQLIKTINPEYATSSYIEDEWEIDRDNVEVISELGKGTFGMVYSGLIKSRNMPCAIKTVNPGANQDDRTEFLNEASVMKSFSGANHVVKLLGVVSRGHPSLVLMELMSCGDLKTYLRKSRDSSQSITSNEMYRMAAEIADGMAYLAAKKFVHRDLAARNCMVAADHTIKIGDFGMARDIYETDYYRKESKGLLPVRWMAPESLSDGVFTTDSDVWSYGVVLWEMVTLAEQPYQGMANEQVFQFVVTHGTLQRPLDCPELLYDIMAACWKWHPIRRPVFINIVKMLEKYVGVTFQLVSFYHSKEGQDYRLNAKPRPNNPPARSGGLMESNLLARYNAMDDDVHLSTHPADEAHPSSYSHLRDNVMSDNSLDSRSSPTDYSLYHMSTP